MTDRTPICPTAWIIICGFTLSSLCWQGQEESLVLAQGTPAVTSTIGSGNLGTAVTQVGNTYQITGGTRPGNGSNLFHSFGEFGVPANNIANFMNETALPTSNILGRVTGGNPSNIFGTIQTTGFGNANLFLMNPAGILFGPNASLNVGGSVSFTTADYLRLADGARFTAVPGAQDAAISSAPVAAFGFLGSNPGAITAQGSRLSVAEGRGIALIGGDISIESSPLGPTTTQPAQLSAPNGQIILASAKSPGEFEAGTLRLLPNSSGQSLGALGEIRISEQSVIETSGENGGTVIIRGGRFLLDNSRISANTRGFATGKGIDIQVTQQAAIQNDAVLETNAFEESTGGSGGDIKIQGNSVSIEESVIETVTEGESNAGNIVIRAHMGLNVSESEIFDSSFFAPGNAGSIELTSIAGDISLSEAFISSQTLQSGGNAGKITATASEGNIQVASSQLFTATRGMGGGGGIEITTKNLELTGSSTISDDNLGPMQPGGITVSLSGNLTLRDGAFIAPVSRSLTGAPAADFNIRARDILITGAGSRLSSETFRAGTGGILNISAETLQLTNGGQIRSGSTIQPVPPAPAIEIPSGAGGTITIQGPDGQARSVLIDGVGSGIFTDAQGTGPGGNINVLAQSMTVQNRGTVSASTSGIESGATGGNISVLARQSLTLSNGGSLTANSTGPANAGNISINAGAQFLSQNASVTTQANQASGGNILIQATDSIRLINSQLSTSVQGGPNTSGGNITLDPAIVTLQNSQILAQAVQGQGGNINIIAGTFLSDPTSIVSASSQFGLSGTVNIQSPVSSLSNTLATLPQRPLQAQQLLSQRCAAQVSGHLSSLVVAGRDTLPIEPGGWLMSPMAFWANEIPSQEAQSAAGRSLAISEQSQVLAGQLSQQLGPSPQRGVSDRATGCGS